MKKALIFFVAMMFFTPLYVNHLETTVESKEITHLTNLEELDISFIKSTAMELADIGKQNDYWCGREYGTSGEKAAKNILISRWNQYISHDCDYVENASLERIDNAYDDIIDDKIEISSRDDFRLEIDGQEIQDCFPIFLMESVESPYYFEDMAIRLAPISIYSQQGPSEEIDDPVAQIGTKYIYLIELKKAKEAGWSPSETFKLVSNLYLMKPNAAAFLVADAYDDTFFMLPCVLQDNSGFIDIWNFQIIGGIPGMMITGSLGEQIRQDIENGNDVKADIFIKPTYKEDVESYNIIGTINGQVSDKTVVIGAHYDAWWGQCYIDNAIGVGTIFAIAKYFADNNIRPYYTLKFVAFSGEEIGMRGSRHYVWKHANTENIQYYINVDTIAYRNSDYYNPRDISLNIWHYPFDESLKNDFQNIVNKQDYEIKTVYGPVDVKEDASGISMCDGRSFKDVPEKAVICFDKGEPYYAWHFYQRDDTTHTKGDSYETGILDEDDLKASAEIILDIIMYASSEPNNSKKESKPLRPYESFIDRICVSMPLIKKLIMLLKDKSFEN